MIELSNILIYILIIIGIAVVLQQLELRVVYKKNKKLIDRIKKLDDKYEDEDEDL